MQRPPFPLADILSRLPVVFSRQAKSQQERHTVHSDDLLTCAPRWTHPEERLTIPVRTESDEDAACCALQKEGQFLARQERWQELAERLADADRNQRRTAGGMPETDLLAYGARADVVNAVEHALTEDQLCDGRQLIDGIMALEAVRKDNRDDPYLTALIAMAHIDIGWLWRGPGLEAAASKAHLRRCAAHFERAAKLLSGLPQDRRGGAFIAAADCALFAARRDETLHVADAFARLIDLAPQNHRPMRALGLQMLPRCSGSYESLELEARRTAARTEDTWGAGAYTWVYFDALATDPATADYVDTKFFIDGLKDIVQICPTQDMANLLSAYCAVSLGGAHISDAEARSPRAEIAKSADWLIRDHLREIHPLVWAHAGQGFDNNARITSLRRFSAWGQAQAMNFIAQIFRDEIAQGQIIDITAEGLRMKAS